MTQDSRLKVVIFSKNRPLQLDLCLRSFQKFCGDARIQDVSVLYKADEGYQSSYETLKIENSVYGYLEETNFQQNVLDLLEGHEQVLFVTDDSIWVSRFNLIEPSKLLTKNSDMLGFSFRLGKNVTYCYSLNQNQLIPNYEVVKKDIIKYCWTSGELDFNYPLEISSSLFLTKIIQKCLKNSVFNNPNMLEDVLANSRRLFLERPWIMSYEQSVAFGNPLNDVAKHGNRFSQKEKFSAEEMLTKYQNGFRVNLDILDGFVPVAPHQEFELY